MKAKILVPAIIVALSFIGCDSSQSDDDSTNNTTVEQGDFGTASTLSSDTTEDGFTIDFNINGGKDGKYDYYISTASLDGFTTIDGIFSYSGIKYSVLGRKNSTIERNLSCVSTNEQSFSCTDNAGHQNFDFTLTPNPELYIYKCFVEYRPNSSKSQMKCDDAVYTISANGI